MTSSLCRRDEIRESWETGGNALADPCASISRRVAEAGRQLRALCVVCVCIYVYIYIYMIIYIMIIMIMIMIIILILTIMIMIMIIIPTNK